MTDNSTSDQGPASSFFLGELVETNLFPFPKYNPEEIDTLKLVIESVDKFMGDKGEEYRKYDQKGEQPEAYIESLKELGLFGLIIPEEYGGIGLSNSGYSRVIQQTSYFDASTSLTIGAHSSIGMKGLLLFGSDDQKKRYLPKLATGESIAAFCLTEPGSGSDAGSIKTTANKNSDGSWTLNGSKIWITNGGIAQFFTVFARTDSESGKMSAFIVERDFVGVTNGPKEDKMGIRASITTTVDFSNVKIPAENLLGEEGSGFKIAMAVLNNGRTGLGGGCVGAMKRCIEIAIKHAHERKQFGRPIAEFGLIQEKISNMTVDCFAAESAVTMVGSLIDRGVKDFSIEAAISKVFNSESLFRVANESLQVLGGNGYMREYPLERVVRDSRINLIFEGTNEILRLYIALSGLKHAGEYLKGVGKGISKFFDDPIKGFGVLRSYAGKRVARATSLGRPKLTQIHKTLDREAGMFETYIADMGKASEGILKKYGQKIIGRQFETKRIADVAVDLFVGLAVLSRVSSIINERGETAASQEIQIAKIFCAQAKARINSNFRRLAKNDDDQVTALAESVLKDGKYRWDVI